MEATAAEIVAHIQREALVHSGLPPISVLGQNFDVRGRRFAALKKEFEGRDEAVALLARFQDTSALLRRVPTPYQDPHIFVWLQAMWEDHARLIYKIPELVPADLLLASASTGRFNAQAILAADRPAILVEDGLLFFARRASYIVGHVAYSSVGEDRFTLKEIAPNPTTESDQFAACAELAELILQYLLAGTVPGVAANAETRPSIGEVIFTSFISFVFEHELHHIRESGPRASVRIHENVAAKFEGLWNFAAQAFKDEPLIELNRERLRHFFYRHSEEHFADMRAFFSVLELGREQRTLSPSIDGMLLFFCLADAIQHAHRLIEDPLAYRAMDGLSEFALLLNALILEESHPYPHLRLAALLQLKRDVSDELQRVISMHHDRLKMLFSMVKQILGQRIDQGRIRAEALHPKWTFDANSLFTTGKVAG